MGSPLSSLALPRPDKLTNQDGFRLMIETHRSYFRQDNNFDIHTVDPHEAFKYQYDLYGYLASQGIHPELHFATMRLSDLERPTEFTPEVTLLNIPKAKVYMKLKGLYVTSLGKVVK